jgi:hypothetical protein
MFAEVTIIGITLSALWVTTLVILWCLAALLPASIAKSKGHSFWGWFFLSLFFWWITLFVTLLMKNRNTPTAAAAY